MSNASSSYFYEFKSEFTFVTRQRRSSRSRDILRTFAVDSYAIAKKLHLCMTIYNVSTAGIIFSEKLLGLTGSIVGLYFLIRLVFVQPGASLLFFALAFNGMSFYPIMRDNASLIPVMIGALKAEIDVVAAARVVDRTYFRRVSRSIPSIGVKVGGFRIIERESTLIFHDFVWRNVTSLLIGLES